ncbi:hypothetical protein BD626DRAFT_499245 [Schizophyllum amplum]|uniref:Uncharacterized protein n=1 Tax=Schizophyllum amplum TaxID=97359 RepID=A0A550CCM5_9AGAR|nr:hypothetical protein BD626DRAFT_499245 [Auriculariopsis ampla]
MASAGPLKARLKSLVTCFRRPALADVPGHLCWRSAYSRLLTFSLQLLSQQDTADAQRISFTAASPTPSPRESLALLAQSLPVPPSMSSHAIPASFRRATSPLNPSSSPSPSAPPSSPFRDRPSIATFAHIASEEARALSSPPCSRPPRTSMILYQFDDPAALRPPSVFSARDPSRLSSMSRSSTLSISGYSDSLLSYSTDSKYPIAADAHGFVPYAYDPAADEGEGPDALHDPEAACIRRAGGVSWRGVANVGAMLAIREYRIAHNTAINSTGQAAEVVFSADAKRAATVADRMVVMVERVAGIVSFTPLADLHMLAELPS